jgi:hypothetical protein
VTRDEFGSKTLREGPARRTEFQHYSRHVERARHGNGRFVLRILGHPVDDRAKGCAIGIREKVALRAGLNRPKDRSSRYPV